MRNKLFILFVILTFILSCKKKNSDLNPTTQTKTSLLIQQTWKFNNAGLDPNKDGSIDQDISSFISPCLTDNTVSFSNNYSGTADEGASKCNANDPQTIPFTWGFLNNETVINITGNAIAGKGGQYKIITLSETQFSLSKDTTITGYGQTTFVVNLKH